MLQAADPAHFRQALVLANSLVSQLQPGCLFQEWFPPTRVDATRLELSDNVNAHASSISDPETTPPSAALTNNISEHWASHVREKRSQWTIDLGQDDATPVCGVELFIDPKNMPMVLHILGSNGFPDDDADAGSGASSIRLARLAGPDLETTKKSPRVSVSFKPSRVRRITLEFEGFGKDNALHQHALTYVVLKTPSTDSLKVTTRGVLQQLVTWAAQASVISAIRGPALLALQGLALASGSLHSLLELCDVLLRENLVFSQQEVSSSKRLLLGLVDSLRLQECRVGKMLRQHGGTHKRPTFNKNCFCNGLTLRFLNTGVHFSSVTRMCAVGETPVTSGSATWEFSLFKCAAPCKLCFGVSLVSKPSESDFEKSKQLYMLCLETKKLYSKGAELATRAELPTLHAGDKLRMILDLDAGTLSYCKPGGKPVLAFTGLKPKGHVYPAVCSYGTDQTVIFTKEEFSVIPPSTIKYLSALEAHDVSVGYGNMGKGSQLGYMGKSILLNKKQAKFGLSLHPPTDGQACATYVIPEGVSVFKTIVALNDDIGDKKTSPITFSVEADGAQLWTSKPLCQAKQTDECEIKLGEYQKLKLVVSCEGAQKDAHAIWFEPMFTSTTELFDRTAVQNIEQNLDNCCSGSKDVASAILAVLSEFADVEMSGMRIPEFCSTQMAEPFCIEISDRTMNKLCALLKKCLHDGDDNVTVSVLRLIKVNLRRLVVSAVDPALLGIQLTEPPTLRGLHGLLDQLIEQMSANKVLGREAAAAVDHGIELLYPTVQSRRALAVKMLEGGATLEIHFEWANKTDSEDGRFERLILMLQMECDTRGWPCALYGEFGSYIHLVMKLQDGATQFVLVRFKEIMLATGFESWSFPVGCDSPRIVLKVERYLDFDRKQRLLSDHGVGWVRLYPLSVGSYEDVCDAVGEFASSYDEIVDDVLTAEAHYEKGPITMSNLFAADESW